MTSPEALRRMRIFLDEKTTDYYEDTDLYRALTEAQTEIAKTIATNWYENLRQTLKPIPVAIKPLMDTKTGILSGGTYFVVSDWLAHVNLRTGASWLTTHVYMENDTTGSLIRNNLLLGTQPTFFQVGDLIYVSNAETTSYSYQYIKRPPAISAGVNPLLSAEAHDALVSRALVVALSDSEAELAKGMMEIYQGQLQGLLQ